MNEAPRPSNDIASPADRRGAERYPCTLPLTWRVLDEDRSGTAHACDISTSGIGLVIDSPVRAGEVLAVKLRCRARQVQRPMTVRVLYALEKENGDWRVGGCFIRPLTQLELRAVLDES